MRYANYPGRGSALTAAIGIGFVVGISPGVVSADAPTVDSVEYTSSNPTPGCWECRDFAQTHASRRPYALERWVRLELGSRPPDV